MPHPEIPLRLTFREEPDYRALARVLVAILKREAPGTPVRAGVSRPLTK